MATVPEPARTPPRWKFDWADALVPLLASIGLVIKAGKADPAQIVGGGIGYALSVALLFCGVRQVLWAVNRRRPVPRPRQPVVAALAGLLFWACIVFRR
jgi:hypothetical protein